VGGMGAVSVPTPPLTTTVIGPGAGELMTKYEAEEEAEEEAHADDGPTLVPNTPPTPKSPGQRPSAIHEPFKAAM